MTIKPIKTERDYRKALKEIENLWDTKPNTSMGTSTTLIGRPRTALSNCGKAEVAFPGPRLASLTGRLVGGPFLQVSYSGFLRENTGVPLRRRRA